MIDESITVAIVTRNRAGDLNDCLLALSKQSKLPKKILIIDNNSKDETKAIIKNFRKRLRLRSVLEKHIGYSIVYDRAIHEANTKWIVFIDDDCVPNQSWYNEVVTAIKRNTQCSAILGDSKNYSPKNIYACAFQFSNLLWKAQLIHGTTIGNFSVLDSRNIIYNIESLRQHSIKFDSSFIYGCEDSDIGLQIWRKNLKAKYIKSISTFHKEPNSLRSYFLKKKCYAKGEQMLHEKWGQVVDVQKKCSIKQKMNILTIVQRELTGVQKVFSLIIIVIDMVLSKLHAYDLFV